MATGSQSDTSLWLHNKLGTSNDSWTRGSIVSQLNPDILNKIERCFQDLQPQVKLKLLLSFFHIPRRNMEQWKRELENILDVAKEDSEPWVCMLAELMKTFPETGQLSSDVAVPDSNRKIFNDLMSEVKKTLKKSAVMMAEGSRKEHLVLPLECHYLNKNAFMSVVGHQPQAIKHFNLRRKPKAAALRAELLNKSADASTKIKSSGGGASSVFPIRKSTMPRKMSDTTPLKGLPSRPLGMMGGGFRNPRVALPNRNPKRESGVKLLDITEQPIGAAAMKKRKKQQEIEEAKLKAEEAKNNEANKEQNSTNANAKNSKNNPGGIGIGAGGKGETPDYAASLNPATPAGGSAYAPPTPSYAPPTPSMPASLNPNPPAPPVVAPSGPPVPKPSAPSGPSSSQNIGPPSAASVASIVTPRLPQTPLPPSATILPTQPLPVASAARLTTASAPTPGSGQPNPIPIAGLQSLQPIPQSALQPHASTLVARLPTQPQPRATVGGTARLVQLPTQPIPQNRMTHIQTRPAVATIVNNLAPGTRIVRTVAAAPGPQQVVQPAPNQTGQPIRRPAPPTLTKEQVHEAQQMFSTANKVTRPEMALILQFMAGSRENPCPNLGNVVTIKLSENQENVLQNDGTYLTMIVETHFQMNYSTGEWKRIKKYRRLGDGAN